MKRRLLALAGGFLLSALAFGGITVINLTNQVSGVLPSANGGTDSAFVDVAGPTALRTYTFPDVNATIPRMVAAGTAALGTGAVASGACSTTVTVAASGVLTTDTVDFAITAVPTSTNMYSWLHIHSWTTAGNVNFAACNASASSRTRTAMTLNWQVIR